MPGQLTWTPKWPDIRQVKRICGIGLLLAGSAAAQYAPIDLPREWTFRQATPAYAVEAPHEPLGDFQPGIRVDVTGTHPGTSRWQVRFKRFGSPDIESLIDPPNLAEADPLAFERVREDIAGFPALRLMLEAKTPWPDGPVDLARRLFPGADALRLEGGTPEEPEVIQPPSVTDTLAAWGYLPIAVSINYRESENPQVIFELWSKGDAFKTKTNPAQANRDIKERLDRIQGEFRTVRTDPGNDPTAQAITAIRLREEAYLLPNDLRVALRYTNGEHLLLTFQSIQALEAKNARQFDPVSYQQTIAENVQTSEGGHRFISGIPMINQGEKGYCAAATLARVLQYYGYSVDQHALAELAKTEAQFTAYQSGGTLRRDIIRAMRRITNSTPFRLKELKKKEPAAILEIIEQGLPIIWFVPGHARLLIGIHPDNREIVYSDSWGLDHAFTVGSWDEFRMLNREMWYLEQQN